MSKISRPIVLLCLLFLSFGLTRAQDGYPLDEPLPVIGPENAAQLTQLAQIGGALPSGLGWSPDGQILAVGLTDSVLLYDITDFSQPRLTLDAPGFFRFETDGERLVVVSSDGQHWDAETGERIPDIAPTSPSGRVTVEVSPNAVTLTGDGAPVTLPIAEGFLIDDLIFSPDETRAIIVTTNFESRWINDFSLWDVETGALVSELDIVQGPAQLVDFMMNGQRLVVFVRFESTYSEPFGQLGVWDVATGELVPMERNLYDVSLARLSADKQLLAFHTLNSSDGEGRVVVWSGQEIGEIRSGVYDSESYADFDFTPDGHNLIVKYADSVSLWEVVNLTHSEDQPGLVERAVITTPDQDLIAWFRPWFDGLRVASLNHWTMIVDIPSGENRLTYKAPTGELLMLIHPELTQVVTSSIQGTFIRDVETDQVIAQFPSNALVNSSFTHVAYWDNGKVVLTVIETGETIEISPSISEAGSLLTVNFPSERALFRQSNGELELYDLATSEATQIEPLEVYSIQDFTPDGTEFIASITPNDPLTSPITALISVENPSQPEVTLPAMSWELLFSPDGRFASALSLGCDIGGAVATLWDANSSQTLAEESGSCGPYSDLFTPDGQWWVVGTDAGFSLYDLDALPQDSVAQQPTVAVHSPDIGRVYDLTFSADGQALATLTNDFSTTNIKVYRFADLLAHTEDTPAQPVLDVVVLSQQPMSLSPDGRWLVTPETLFEVASGASYPRPVGNRVAFSSDGTLAAFADNGVVFLVDLTDEPTLLHSLPVVGPSFVGFSPDRTRLYAADRGRVRVFGVPPG